MNRYDHTFIAVCPSDGAMIIYHLKLKSKEVVKVEDIAACCRFAGPVYHEDIADALAQKFGGKQTITAMHQGIFLTTKRGQL